MELKLERKTFTDRSTIGNLWINGEKFCFTLEDVTRPEGVKIDGQTAIPKGIYKVVIDDSVRFGRRMPHILDVPNFDGIRIHSGNTSKDTEGCVLVGYAKDEDVIYRSKDAFNDLFPKLNAAQNMGEEITIEIIGDRQ